MCIIKGEHGINLRAGKVLVWFTDRSNYLSPWSEQVYISEDANWAGVSSINHAYLRGLGGEQWNRATCNIPICCVPTLDRAKDRWPHSDMLLWIFQCFSSAYISHSLLCCHRRWWQSGYDILIIVINFSGRRSADCIGLRSWHTHLLKSHLS